MRYIDHKRNTQKEWMDDPHIDPTLLDKAVADINKCNRWLGGYGFTKSAVARLMDEKKQDSYRIIDIGCSDGAMLRYLSEQLPLQQLDLLGLDLSPRSIEQAREKSKEYDNVSFRVSDIFTTPLQDIQCDIVILSLTLHHFAEEDILKFIARFQEMARIGIVINDLHRSRIAYSFFKLLSPIFIRNEISIHDGLISIASGFKRSDFKRYAQQLQIQNDLVEWKWSFRFIWIIPTYERNN